MGCTFTSATVVSIRLGDRRVAARALTEAPADRPDPDFDIVTP